MSKVITEIDSKVNEFFSKTKVTQKFANTGENPLELKIYVFKKDGVIFSSFNCQIGDSIKVKSKVIKKEKAEQKYTDSVASGNAAIFVSYDPKDENRIIINMGNIPGKTDVIFISEFIQSIEASKKYEFEIFRNLPIFQGKDDEIYENSELSGTINIKTKAELINIEKKILMKDLKIIEEKYQNNTNNDYLINYKIEKLPSFSWYNLDYIPCSKIYFDLNINEPFALIQNSSLAEKENNYFVQYRYKKENINNDNETKNHPALFIFLVDQSGSMWKSIKIAAQALQLFIQSLPAGSYYQIIGFGSTFVKYDKIPKEYNKENIKESMKIIEKLDSSLGGTDIYSPLKDIYNSSEIYDKINLPRNIFLLTDGEIDDKEKTLALIEKNNLKYTIYSIGIGNSFDKDLIKNAGIIGNGNYNFCKNLDNLNSIIASEINNATSSYVANLKINTNLSDKNIIKNVTIPNILRDNEIVNLYYIINDKNIDKIKMEISYTEDIGENKDVKKNYEIIPETIEKGEELSKLIINNYILNNKDIIQEEKLKLALKYQIFTNDTSLFAEVELSEKIPEEMKLKIIGDKENNVIKQSRKNIVWGFSNRNIWGPRDLCLRYDHLDNCEMIRNEYELNRLKENFKSEQIRRELDIKFENHGQRNKRELLGTEGKIKIDKIFAQANAEEKRMILENRRENNNDLERLEEKKINCCYNLASERNACVNNDDENDDYNDKDEDALDFGGGYHKEKTKSPEIKEKNETKLKKKEIELNNKDNIMKMINTQDFIEGYWEENEFTRIVKEKYKKEFELLKALKDKNIDDKTAITILIIYFIDKMHSDLLAELLMIIKKAKSYIQKRTKEKYENIIKEIGLY